MLRYEALALLFLLGVPLALAEDAPPRPAAKGQTEDHTLLASGETVSTSGFPA